MIEVNDLSAFPAGLPILEVIRKLEQEKVLSKEERILISELVNDGAMRPQLFKCLNDFEIGANSKFAIRRLKALLYQSGSGLPSRGILSADLYSEKGSAVTDLSPSLRTTNNKVGKRDRGDQVPAPSDSNTVKTISKAFGDDLTSIAQGSLSDAPTVPYVHPDNYNVCNKIIKRLGSANAEIGSKYCVLIGSGSCNPLTRMHLRRYYVAKQYLESSHLGITVLGCLLSPSHATTVRERYKTNSHEIIPSPHRLAMSQLLVEDSNFISVDPWEITRRRPMDIMSLLEHTSDMLKSQFPVIDIRVLCLSKGNTVPKLSPQLLKEGNFGVVCVTRPSETDSLRASLGSRWNGALFVVEDYAVVDASLDIVSSKKVRERLRVDDSITHLVGERVAQYCSDNRIGFKMNGSEEWTHEDKSLPKIVSRNESNTRRNLPPIDLKHLCR